MSYIADFVESEKRAHLEQLLTKCTTKQREKFKNLFPHVHISKIDAAIMLCVRTLQSNEAALAKGEFR